MICSLRRRFVFWVLASCWLAHFPQLAWADVCIPLASGVPALAGPPNWDTSSGVFPHAWSRLDDPRWHGAYALSFGSGAVEQVSFRMLKGGSGDIDELFLSWHIKADAELTPSFDGIALAISPGGGAKDVLIQIYPFDNVAVNMTAEFPKSTETRLRLAGAAFGNKEQKEPVWLAGGTTHVWLDVANQTWAVNMKLPITNGYDAGIDLQSSFKLWFEVPVSQPDGTVVLYRNSALDFASIENGTSSASWPQFNRTTVPGGAGCDKGISLSVSNVGTKHVNSSSQIDLTGPNTFFARPTNKSGAAVPPNRISATFRIANWGTQPDWNSVTDPSDTLWKQIGGIVSNAGSIANGATASEAAGNEITLAWTLTNVERCEFDPTLGAGCPNPTPTRRQHQCMLVELGGGGFAYTPASVYRNMDFVNASKFEREAEISVVGLPELAGAPTRDVYLFVRPYNLPADVDNPPPADSLRDFKALQEFLRKVASDSRDAGGTAVRSEIPTLGELTDVLSLKTENGKLAGRPPPSVDTEILSQIYPTYIVHAYHDTGKTLTWRGTTRKVLQPQSSFGYHIHHEGDLKGWQHMLVGAEQVGPDFYKIAVPQNGAKSVSTVISTCNDQPCKPDKPHDPSGDKDGGNAGGQPGVPDAPSGCSCVRAVAIKTTPPVGMILVVSVGMMVSRRRRQQGRRASP